MESARKIIDAINRGVSPQELAREFPWEEIIGDSAVELLNFAQHSPNNQHSFKVLAYLFRVANENNLWFATEVLSQTVRHPILSSDERKMILANLRSLLDKIKSQIAANPPTDENLRKYWLMEGGYFTVSGATFAETGKIEEANKNYSIAQGIFEQMGLIQPGMKYSGGGVVLPEPGGEQSTGVKPSPPAPRIEEGQPAVLQAIPSSAQPPASRKPGEEKPATADLETFHPLPDVYFESGHLHLPEVEQADQDEVRRQVLQIEQQSEILAGIQLQIQMYLNRRSVLAKEVQSLERKVAIMRAALARLEKK